MHEPTGFPIYPEHRFCLRCIIKSRIGKATCSPASRGEIGFQIMRIPITVIGIYIYYRLYNFGGCAVKCKIDGISNTAFTESER